MCSYQVPYLEHLRSDLIDMYSYQMPYLEHPSSDLMDMCSYQIPYLEHPSSAMFVNEHVNEWMLLPKTQTIRLSGRFSCPLPYPVVSQTECDAYEALNDAQNEVACLMLGIKAFHACKQEDGQSVSSYLLKMKSYVDTLERLGYAMPKEHGKDKKKPQGAKGKAKGKNKLAYDPKTKIPPPPKRENLIKDSICHHCKEVGHWRRNCPSYHAELKKRKNASKASNSGT
ncbi:zinc finger, CCHC-type containing protein [Tanacetum coccineum]